ncbi:MAG: hybrid sensor histidine kinase/response regulator [Gemmataceae bacterium]|nr:hybrid sensor histidine kinase/response regulator [Gemmataceae bacterium]
MSKPCLLVVDDEPDLVQSVKDLLRFDYRVLGATRASEGLKIVANEPVQVVMSDQRMPEMTGVEFLRCLRNRHPEVIRLLFTAYSDWNAVIDAINEGHVYRYIAKPWQPDELKAVMRQACDYYDLHADRRRLLMEVQQSNRQLEAANAELRQANELKRVFIRVASHELRTPLTIISGLSELAANAPADAPPEWMGQIHAASQRLNRQIDSMATLLHAERFDRTPSPKDTAVAELLRVSAHEVRSFVEQRGQHLWCDGEAEAGWVRVEPDKIRDAIVQLLMNAIKFTPDGGTIRLQARRDEWGGTEIEISDNGIGIDSVSQTHLFEPFFTRMDASRHRSGTFEFNRRGMGLGLATAKAFVEMHGGTIKMRSAPGEGSTFTIVLPASLSATPPPQGEFAI